DEPALPLVLRPRARTRRAPLRPRARAVPLRREGGVLQPRALPQPRAAAPRLRLQVRGHPLSAARADDRPAERVDPEGDARSRRAPQARPRVPAPRSPREPLVRPPAQPQPRRRGRGARRELTPGGGGGIQRAACAWPPRSARRGVGRGQRDQEAAQEDAQAQEAQALEARPPQAQALAPPRALFSCTIQRFGRPPGARALTFRARSQRASRRFSSACPQQDPPSHCFFWACTLTKRKLWCYGSPQQWP